MGREYELNGYIGEEVTVHPTGGARPWKAKLLNVQWGNEHESNSGNADNWEAWKGKEQPFGTDELYVVVHSDEQGGYWYLHEYVIELP